MKLIRYQYQDREAYGVLEGESVRELTRPPFSGIQYNGEVHGLGDVHLLTPTAPQNIVAVGLNYKKHAEELKMTLPGDPLVFSKPASAALAPFGKILRPPVCERLDYEAELAVIIKKDCEKVSKEEAEDYILGYTCLNDVTARDIQNRENQWLRAKGYYTFCPFGPHIETELDPSDLRLTALLNGTIVQDTRTSDMLFTVSELIAHISSFMRLGPGDVVSTGTPGGIGPMQSGDEIIVRIEGIGDLVNTVL